MKHERRKRILQRRVIKHIKKNFKDDDLCIIIVQRDSNPSNELDTKKDIVNYIRKVKRLSTERGWEQIKYAYITDKGVGYSVGLNGKDGK